MWLTWQSVSIEPGLSWDPPSPDPDLEFVYMSYPMASLSRPRPDVQQPQGGQSPPECLCGPSHHLKAGAIPKAMGQMVAWVEIWITGCLLGAAWLAREQAPGGPPLGS